MSDEEVVHQKILDVEKDFDIRREKLEAEYKLKSEQSAEELEKQKGLMRKTEWILWAFLATSAYQLMYAFMPPQTTFGHAFTLVKALGIDALIWVMSKIISRARIFDMKATTNKWVLGIVLAISTIGNWYYYMILLTEVPRPTSTDIATLDWLHLLLAIPFSTVIATIIAGATISMIQMGQTIQEEERTGVTKLNAEKLEALKLLGTQRSSAIQRAKDSVRLKRWREAKKAQKLAAEQPAKKPRAKEKPKTTRTKAKPKNYSISRKT